MLFRSDPQPVTAGLEIGGEAFAEEQRDAIAAVDPDEHLPLADIGVMVAADGDRRAQIVELVEYGIRHRRTRAGAAVPLDCVHASQCSAIV